jgi:hypothetical protein
MKKILIFLFLLLSNLVYSQNPLFARAYQFSVGYKNENNETVWQGKPTECNILIRFDDNELIIYSKEIQKYHMINKVDSKDGTTLYLMSDIKGLTCNYYLGKTKDSVFVLIEYLDISWVYFIELEK